MISRFFIDRPIFAAVLSIFIVIAGLAAMRVLPIAQYPEIAPPVVTVRAVYPGASAEVLEQTVAAPLENQINGVENMLYMSSTSASSGVVEIQVTFEIGADVDKAALNVNNRVKQAEPRLPQEVRRQGVTVEKGSSAFLQVLAFYFARRQPRRSVHLELRDAQRARCAEAHSGHDQRADLRRQGLRDAHLGAPRPPRAAQAHDVGPDPRAERAERAVRGRQDRPVADRRPQELVYTITTKGRLAEPEQFENIVVRANPDGSILRLKDVARVELGSKDYEFIGRVNGKPATLVGIFLQPGANALATGERVGKTMTALVRALSQGLRASVPSTTRRASCGCRSAKW